MVKVCAVVPAYNEAKFISSTIDGLKKIETVDSIVVVDDGSFDDTYNIMCLIDGIVKIRHENNMGKAASIMDGIKSCRADVYLFVDGDLGESSAKLCSIVNEILTGSCDMCAANIPFTGGSGGFGFLRYFSKTMVRLLTGIDFPCPLSGMRAVTEEVLQDKRINYYSGFGIEAGMLVDILRSGYNVKCMDLKLKHDVTYKNVQGFLHRSEQFFDITSAFLKIMLRW